MVPKRSHSPLRISRSVLSRAIDIAHGILGLIKRLKDGEYYEYRPVSII